jgi:membrane-bound lytic murein transglycosylase B
MVLLRNFTVLILILTQTCACASESQSSNQSIKPDVVLAPELKSQIPETNESPTEFADKQLKASGISEDFIQKIHALYLSENPKLNKAAFKEKDWEESASQILTLNDFGFLYLSDYMAHDSPLAVRKIKRYLKDHKTSFRAARRKYAVSSSTIASLLWVETKHGKIIGTFPLPWVFYSLVMGSHPQFIKEMLAELPGRLEKGNPKNLTLFAAQTKVIERCKSKATWALEELKAIQQINAENDFNPFRSKASFAGAFGFAQFIPSTYLKLAVSEFRSKPDLFKHSDAIASVAHFLQMNGWKDNNPDLQAQALFAYNRSKDYGSVILKLSQEVTPKKTARK